MGWRDFLQPASFRGVPFFVESSDTSVGRRTKLHTYYKRDIPYLQDLGAAPDEFVLEGFVIQNSANNFNYMPERDALIAALKQPGSGILVHPYFGELQVGLLEPAKISETTDEGGMARFSMIFAQSGRRTIDTTRDYSTLLDNLIALLRAKGLDDFFNAYESVAGVLGDIQTALAQVVDAINTVRNGISSAIAKATGIISSILVTIDTLIDAPCDLAADLLRGTDAILTAVGMADEVLTGGVVGGCSGLRNDQKNTATLEGESDAVILDGTEIPEDLGTSVLQAMVESTVIDETTLDTIESETHSTSRTAVLNLIKFGTLLNVARMGIRINFSSQEKLIENTELVADFMDTFLFALGETDNLELYTSMQELRATFVKYMYEKATTLIRNIEYIVPGGVQSTLVLAYNRYDDITRDKEIFQKNRPLVRHPGFLPGGSRLELLDE